MCRRESVWGNILGRLVYPVERRLIFPQRSLVLVNPNYITFGDISSDPANSKLASYVGSLPKPAEGKHNDVVLYVHFHIIILYAYCVFSFSTDITLIGGL